MIVGIVGGGKGGASILRALQKMKEIEVAGIVDIKEDAPGIQLAKELRIFHTNSIAELFQRDIDLVIEATGKPQVEEKIENYKSKEVRVLCSKGANLMMGLVENEERLIGQLEEQFQEINNLGNVTKKSIEKMHNSIRDTNAISITLNNFAETTINLVKETDGIIRFMHKITQQTNILGLNASIEAARAGENGRGFAVVATEVQKLANNNQEFTKKIEDTLNTINEEVRFVAVKIQELERVSQDRKQVGENLETAMKNLLKNVQKY